MFTGGFFLLQNIVYLYPTRTRPLLCRQRQSNSQETRQQVLRAWEYLEAYRVLECQASPQAGF